MRILFITRDFAGASLCRRLADLVISHIYCRIVIGAKFATESQQLLKQWKNNGGMHEFGT
jgi:hypothetical protein